MIVHIVGSVRDIDEDVKYLRRVIETIHDKGGVLAHNWLEHEIIRRGKGIQTSDWTPYVQANLDAVKRADLIILEVTHYAFTQGFLLAAALEHKKPILAVSRTPINDKTIIGITSPLLTLDSYTDVDELTKITDDFLVKNTVHTKDLRFNMFLTRPIYKYLENVMQETGKTKSEIIRELIKRRQAETRK